METANLKEELLETIQLFSQLNPMQKRTLCQFVQVSPNSSAEEGLPALESIIRKATSEQLNEFSTVAAAHSGRSEEEEEDEGPEKEVLAPFTEAWEVPPASLVDSLSPFNLLLSLAHLRSLLRSLGLLGLMKLMELLPPGPPVQQLQLLQHLQQLLRSLQPQVLQAIHQQLQQTPNNPSQDHASLSALLQLPPEYFHLYHPLRLLFQLELDELISLKKVLPALLPAQMLHLLQLLQLQPFDVLELRSIFHPQEDTLGSAGEEIEGEGAPSSPPLSPSGERQLRLQIVEQPPEKSVYKRNLKPNPMVLLVGDQKQNDGNLYVVPTLVRCDTFAEEPKFLTGNRPVRVTSGRVLTFRKLKITTTSHQQQETLFCIKFELRRYHGDEEWVVEDAVHSNPVCVLSHSTQMKPLPSTAPVVQEVIPARGSTQGGTRVAVLGSHFVESPAARIRFDMTDVMPSFHGPGTLLCHTPQHPAGTVPVRVANAPKKWSDSSAPFTFDASLQPFQPPWGMVVPVGPSSAPSSLPPSWGDHASDSDEGGMGGMGGMGLSHAAWEGNGEAVERLLAHGAAVNRRDERGYTPLHYAAGQGFLPLVRRLLRAGGEVNAGDREGHTPLYWAVLAPSLPVVLLLLQHGADASLGPCPPAVAAAGMGYWGVLGAVLEHSPAAVRSHSLLGASPLHAAAAVGGEEGVRLCLRYGVGVYQRDEEGETALWYALREGHLSVAAAVLEAGPVEGHRHADTGETALHWAVEVADGPAAALLLAAGCSPHSTDVEGLSPWDLVVPASPMAHLLSSPPPFHSLHSPHSLLVESSDLPENSEMMEMEEDETKDIVLKRLDCSEQHRSWLPALGRALTLL